MQQMNFACLPNQHTAIHIGTAITGIKKKKELYLTEIYSDIQIHDTQIVSMGS
jgi:hypothetical protein